MHGSLLPTDLHEDHGGDLLGRESLVFAEVLNLDRWAATVIHDLEGPRLDVLLDNGVIKTATDQTPFNPSQSASNI